VSSRNPGTGALIRRLALESVVIIGSILAAFALDTWWEGVQERRDERLVLDALHAEFSTARDVLIEYRGLQARVLTSVSSSLDALHAAHASGRRFVAIPDTALALMFVPPTTQLSLGTLEGLVASSRLGIIQDRELRALLGGWGSNLAELTEEEEGSRDFVEDQVEAVFWNRMNTSSFRTLVDSLFPVSLSPERRAATSRVPVDEPMVGVFATRSSLLRHALEEFQPVVAEVDSILARIERSRAD
jgi:hypothetical protein